jgi:hydroxypyruvate isomerase
MEPLTMDHDRREFFKAATILAAAGSTITTIAASTSANETVELPGKTPHTKFAVNVEMWWSNLPFLDRLRKTAELGFFGYEFWPYENKDLAAVVRLNEELKLSVAQFTAWGFEPGMNHPSNEDAFEKKIIESCKVAHQLNCPMMTVVAGNIQKGMTQDAMLAQVVKALKRVKPIVEKEGIMLILEPMNGRVDHPGHCLYGSVDAVKICREVDSPMVKINWDLYHMQISEGDLCGRLKDGFDQVGYLQLADHPGRYEPGTGEIYYPRVLRAAHELGYRGFVGLECRPKEGEDLAAKRVNQADQW